MEQEAESALEAFETWVQDRMDLDREIARQIAAQMELHNAQKKTA